MIRVVIFLVAVGILAFAAVWLADRPGDVVITWQGCRIEMSVMVPAVARGRGAAFSVLWPRRAPSCGRPNVLWLYLRTPRRARLSRGVARADCGRHR